MVPHTSMARMADALWRNIAFSALAMKLTKGKMETAAYPEQQSTAWRLVVEAKSLLRKLGCVHPLPSVPSCEGKNDKLQQMEMVPTPGRHGGSCWNCPVSAWVETPGT